MERILLILLILLTHSIQSQSEVRLSLTTAKPNKKVYKKGNPIFFISTITNHTESDITIYRPKSNNFLINDRSIIKNSLKLHTNLPNHCGASGVAFGKRLLKKDFLIIKAYQTKKIKFERMVCHDDPREHEIKLEYTPQKIDLTKLKKDLNDNFSEKESRDFFNLFIKQYPHPLVSNLVTIKTK